MPEPPMQRPRIRATDLGELISRDDCERRAKFAIAWDEVKNAVPFSSRGLTPLDVSLQESGRKRAAEWNRSLRRAKFVPLNGQNARTDKSPELEWTAFRQRLLHLTPGRPAFAREVEIEANVGLCRIHGKIDFILVFWRGGEPWLRLVECKASRQNKTQHLFQIAAYRLALRELLRLEPLFIAGIPLHPDHIESIVARIDEVTGTNQSLLDLPSLDLEHPMADLEWQLSEDGLLARVDAAPLNALAFQLNSKCHDCAYSYNCVAESGRQRRLELIGLDPTTIGVLRDTGIITIDALAELDLDGTEAETLRANPKFTEFLPVLRQRARARRRTLPDADLILNAGEVESLPSSGRGQLPPHEAAGQCLVRAYLSIAYDHIEARIVCLSAHITHSDGLIETGLHATDGKKFSDPDLYETTRQEGERRAEAVRQPLSGENVIEILPTPWTGDMQQDNELERDLLHRFFLRLTEVIQATAEADHAPLHFYVWNRSDITLLMEACQRCGSALLWHLSQLFGCRERLEQQMISSLQDEVYSRYATGWTSQTLIAATSLYWYGRAFHWTRKVGGSTVNLAKFFVQDQHDFTTGLRIKPDGTWADPADVTVGKRTFEIRARFHDNLPLPYLYAHLGMLPQEDAPGLEKGARDAIRRYRNAIQPGYLEGYLQARLEALRWIEEGIPFKNYSITKTALPLSQLTQFQLGEYTPVRAALDYLRMEQWAAVQKWMTEMLVPPLYRVAKGDALPIRDVRSLGKGELEATLDLERYKVSHDTFRRRCSLGEYARLTPYSGDPSEGQKQNDIFYDGATCHVIDLDWEAGIVRLKAVFSYSEEYRLPSRSFNDAGEIFSYATLDNSICDFVAMRVDSRLRQGRGAHIDAWFDPDAPLIPPQREVEASRAQQYRRLLKTLGLTATQIDAAVAGLNARIQILQGPPGTGKTVCAAAATLLRILAHGGTGDIVVLTAPTHTALQKLLENIEKIKDNFAAKAVALGFSFPDITLSEVFSMRVPKGDSPLVRFRALGCQRAIRKGCKHGVMIIAGTPGAALKMVRFLETKGFLKAAPDGFQASQLLVDEASMLPAPYFLALASLVREDGEILLVGDHRQLAPIQAHDWKTEDRPSILIHQPFQSAFAFLRNLKGHVPDDRALLCSALDFTHRLTPSIRSLLGPAYLEDGIELTGSRPAPLTGVPTIDESLWSLPWQKGRDLTLFVHDERNSRRCNELEAAIAAAILGAATQLPERSIALLTPHRAQRAYLNDCLIAYRDAVDIIDTVERLQGNERPTIILSATASAPATISSTAEFLLNANRALVAFSRSNERSILICSATLLNNVSAEWNHYQSSILYKRLRALCSAFVGETHLGGHRVRVFHPRPANSSNKV